MKRKLLLVSIVLMSIVSYAELKPISGNLKTTWGENIKPDNVWQEYPRPIMERNEWKNLNGLWEYAILPLGKTEPSKFEGKILVPFCIESSLSGVCKRIDEKHELWYKREFSIPTKWKGKRIKLNFEAVDWKTEVYVNGELVGSHTGGYTPFSFDITSFLKNKTKQIIIVKVWDPTHKGTQPIGKQMINNHLIWYTPVSGIWQTVWLEPTDDQALESITTVADIDNELLKVKIKSANTENCYVEVTVKDGNTVVSSTKAIVGKEIVLPIKSAKLWSPSNPFLYTLEVALFSNGKEVDRVKSYTAMRKISQNRDENGYMRIQLNNKDIFLYGPLDQGWWPDGLYTPPSDEAMLYDIKKTKEWGFNTIRKHMKVEPARWYTYCDKIGLLVWQDMPSGDAYPKWEPFKYYGGEEVKRTPESAANYWKEWKEIMDHLMPYPCIAIWTTFNEAWGQFNTESVADWTKKNDPSRLVDPASGGNHRACGDILDIHHYPEPALPLLDLQRINVIGEFGGIQLTIRSNLWKADPKEYWDSKKIKTKDEATKLYVEYLENLKKLIPKGLSAAVYTQTTDVEVEVNGFMTYDRKVIKMDEDSIKKSTSEISNWYK